ncbi:hypothetical protein [Brevibacillus sp. H7]|uniref:hypothetical protein n=1 Tax=Brevibacillus sp. H7 TaxID=3349138 RepID=UPI00382A8369
MEPEIQKGGKVVFIYGKEIPLGDVVSSETASETTKDVIGSKTTEFMFTYGKDIPLEDISE